MSDAKRATEIFRTEITRGLPAGVVTGTVIGAIALFTLPVWALPALQSAGILIGFLAFLIGIGTQSGAVQYKYIRYGLLAIAIALGVTAARLVHDASTGGISISF